MEQKRSETTSAGPEHGGQNGATGLALLDNQRVYDLVVNRIATEVETRMAQRATRRRNLAIGVIGVAGVLLIGAASFFHETLVNRAATAALDRRIGDLLSEVEVASLTLETTDLINTIKLGGGFNEAQKNAVMDIMKKSANVDHFVNRPSFLPQLESFVDILAGSGSKIEVNTLEEIYRSQMIRSPGIAVTLVQHYGRQLLGSPGAPGDWDQPPYSDVSKRFNVYTHVAKDTLYPEAYLLHQMLIEYLLNQSGARPDDEIVRELIAEIDDLNDVDSPGFWRVLGIYARNAIQNEPTRETTRIAKRTIAFLEQYQDVHEDFREILAEVDLMAAGDGDDVLEPELSTEQQPDTRSATASR